MPLTVLRPWIMTAIVASIATMVSAIHAGVPAMSWGAAGLFAAALVAACIDMNRPLWTIPPHQLEPGDAVLASIRNARLLTLGYLWGSLALVVIYRLTPLRWQHGMQYAAAMGLMAWLIMLYVHFLSRAGSRLRTPRLMARATWLSLAHGAAALAGTVFLLTSGKIFSPKGDWAANQIFLTGGLAVTALSLISAYTQFKLGRTHQGGVEAAAGE